MNESIGPLEAAKRFIADKFPSCQAAVMAGSVVRGEHTATSDLDIVVFDNKVESAYRESFIAYDWPIEVFVHNFTSYKDFFKLDCERARSSLPRMISEGLIIIDSGVICAIKAESDELLKKGPAMWSMNTMETKRYMLTDALDDLIGSTNRAEELFIVNTLADAIHEFILRTNGKWVGESKWVVRALNHYDEDFAGDSCKHLIHFIELGVKMKLSNLQMKY